MVYLRRSGHRLSEGVAARPPKGFEDVDAQRAQFLDQLGTRLRQVDAPLAEDVRRAVTQ